MNTSRTIVPAAALIIAAGVAAPGAAQSDPANFGTVYNIGTVPAGSFADVPGAVTGTQVGDGDGRDGTLLTPTDLSGDTLGSNSQLNLFDGGEILIFFTAGPLDGTGSNIEFNVLGGTVGDAFSAQAGSTVNITGGSIGDDFRIRDSKMNISDGSVGDGFQAAASSVVNLSGGSIGDGVLTFDGSTFNISGGSVGNDFAPQRNSTVNISGGTIGTGFEAFAESTVNILGTSFLLDGVGLTDLVLDEAFEITERGGTTLTAVLADGSLLDFDLNDTFVSDEDYFDSEATLTVTLVPTPGAAGLLGIAGFAAARRRR